MTDYTMAIKLLIALLRRRVQGGVGLELGFKDPIVVSSYADDLSVVVKNEQDLQAVVGTLQIYQRASSAKVNWGKSGTLLCGVWRESEVPQLPGGLEWSREGMKVLGVYLGSEGWVSRNWEGVPATIATRLAKWKWILSQISYRGWTVTINNLGLQSFIYWCTRGGQGLVDLQSRVAAYRLQAALETAVSQMFAGETWHRLCYDGPVAPDWTGSSSC